MRKRYTLPVRLVNTRVGSTLKETYCRAFDSETKALKSASNQLVGCIPQVRDDCFSKFRRKPCCGCRALQDYQIVVIPADWSRSEERRVGKECRSRWSPYH